MEKQVRGSSLLGVVIYIQTGLDSATRQRVLEKLPAGHVDEKRFASTTLYPIEESNILSRAIASSFDNPDERYQAFIQCGRTIATDAINSFLRLLIKFLKPHLLARKYNDFFRRVHTFGKFEVKSLTPNGFVVELSDVAGYDYVAPMSIGFISHMLDAMGCRNLVVKEVNVPPASPQDTGPYRFEVVWS